MAKSKFKKGPTGVSFPGVFVFPKLSDVDFGSDEYPKPAGEFSVKVKGRLDDPKVKSTIAYLQPMHDEAIKIAKEEFKKLKPETRKKLKNVTVQPLYETIYDEEENETGEVLFKFSMKYSGEYKSGKKEGETWYRTPAIFDAQGGRITYFRDDPETGEPIRIKSAPDIWGGTVGRIAYEVGLNKEGKPGYFIPATGMAGLSLKLEAARIIDLVTKGQRSAESYFGDEDDEGGYSFDGGSADADDAAEEEAAPKSKKKAKKAKADVPADDEDDTDF